MWEEFANYGVLKVLDHSILIYKSNVSWSVVEVSAPIRSAMWQGNGLIVQLETGVTRRYSDMYTYTSI